MLDSVLRFAKKFIPKTVFTTAQPVYHWLLAFLGALIYRFPSRSINIVAVTGTKGKSSTVEIINSILETAGHQTAILGTIRFKIGDQSQPNRYKMTIPGRFFVSRFLRQAVDAKCDYAVIEMTSEGAKQFRHKFVELDALIFLNLSPEHIESHGSYENYREAKLSIARALETSKKPHTVLVANQDDPESVYFLAADVRERATFSLDQAQNYQLRDDSLEFTYEQTRITAPLVGKFNLQNVLAAIAYAKTQNISLDVIKGALAKLAPIKGRVEKVSIGANQKFEVIVDYAHTADSLEKLYQAFPNQKKVCVLGATGGGRDQWKRSEMGKIADTYCDQIILTNEDPYDEDPKKIVLDVESGITNHQAEIIMDRRGALKKAFELASKQAAHSSTLRQAQGTSNQDIIVLITGKGTDPYIMGPRGSKTPWSDVGVAKEELEKILQR